MDRTGSASPLAPDTPRLSRTACERCRRHKLRCSRVRPTCDRCQRLSTACSYPEPANRRLLAAQREALQAKHVSECLSQPSLQSVGTNPPDTGTITTDSATSSSVPVFTECSPLTGDCDTLCNKQTTSSINLATLPPRAIGLGLIDIYFERLYNAHLLFQKQRVFIDYLNGTLPSFLLKALFAGATMYVSFFAVRSRPWRPRRGKLGYSRVDCQRFLTEQDAPVSAQSDPTKAPTELTALRPYAAFGESWATSAALQVLQQADRPAVHSVQAMSCLSMYWFSKSDMERARMHIVIAYASCSSFRPLAMQSSGSQFLAESRDLEDKRRCFWACWASVCTAAIPDAYARNAWEEASGVPLPLDHELGCTDIDPPAREYMDKYWNCLTVGGGPSSEQQPRSSLTGEFLKLMAIWAHAQVLVRNDPEISQIEKLADAARRVYDSPSFPPATADAEPLRADEARLVGLHSLYHLCQMVLLCPLVSIFSGRHRQSSITTDATRHQAETIIEHAGQHYQLVQQYLIKGGDVTRIAPLTAFASFVSTSILLLAIKSRIQRARNHGTEFKDALCQVSAIVADTLRLLDVLQMYWEPLRPMTEEIRQKAASLPRPADDTDVRSIGRSPRQLRIPLTGANSPVRGENPITTTYVENQHRGLEDEEGSGSNAESRFTFVNTVTSEVPSTYFDANMFDFELSSDQDLDFLAFYPIHVG